MSPKMKRLRNVALVVGLGTSVGQWVYASRLICERVLWRVPDGAVMFSALHSTWAFVFIVAALCAVVAPLSLLIVGTYCFFDDQHRTLWMSIAALLALGIAVTYAPASAWHLLLAANIVPL